MTVEREDRKSKDCALVTSMLKDPRDEEKQGKETEREHPVGRGGKCAVLDRGEGFHGSMSG